MARLKTQEDRRIPVPEDEYLRLMENTMVLEALEIAGIRDMPIWKAMMRILMTSGWRSMCILYARHKKVPLTHSRGLNNHQVFHNTPDGLHKQ